MAVYKEIGGFEEWADKLHRDFYNVTNAFIKKYDDKTPEELFYVMNSAISKCILLNNIKKKIEEEKNK